MGSPAAEGAGRGLESQDASAEGPAGGTADPALAPARAAEEEIQPVAETALQGSRTPGVLFVCVRNGGKSQMAAGLMRWELERAGRQNAVVVASAGTEPGDRINALSAEVLDELGADITAERPTRLTEDAMRQARHVVVLGTEAEVPELPGVTVERWETAEPSLHGVEGRERMVLIREDILARVGTLQDRLLG